MARHGAVETLASLAGWNGANTRLCRRLGGSDTNRSWCIERDGARFVLRIDTPLAAKLGLDRERELHIRRVVAQAGLAPAVAFADPARGILISDFQPGRAWSARALHDAPNLSRLAERLRSLHALPPIDEPFCLATTVNRYAGQTRNATAQSAAHEALDLLAQITPRQHVICHNDLVAANVIDGDALTFIDWEYAGVGDPLFDLAIVIEHHQLPAALEAHFVRQRFGSVDAVVSADLARYRRIYACVVILWAALGAESGRSQPTG